MGSFIPYVKIVSNYSSSTITHQKAGKEANKKQKIKSQYCTGFSWVREIKNI